jgi:tetratricopeptide (TPR) repeat protein
MSFRRFRCFLRAFTFWAFGACGVASAADERAGSPEELKQHAATQYEAGVSAYREGRYQDAVQLFLAADRLVPSAVLSFNVARGYEKLGDSARALAHYRDYLRREPSAANAEAVRRRVEELEAVLQSRGLQQLTVLSAPAGAHVTIDEQPVGVTPWTGELAPGTHRIRVSRPGYADDSRGFELRPERALELSVALLPAGSSPSDTPPSARTTAVPKAATNAPEIVRSAPPSAAAIEASDPFGPWPWLALGLGGATLVAAGGFELSRRSAEDDARAAPNQLEYADRLDAMQGRQTIARVLGVTGALAAATGGVLLLISKTAGTQPAATAGVRWYGGALLGGVEASF